MPSQHPGRICLEHLGTYWPVQLADTLLMKYVINHRLTRLVINLLLGHRLKDPDNAPASW
jgi:hypothetical protein